MKNTCRLIIVLLVLFFAATAVAHAELPDLPKQELWVKIVSLVVGLIVIFALSIFGLNKLMFSVLGMDGEMATKLSIILAFILSFLWFLYIFGQIFDATIKIALGVLIVIGGLMFFLREKPDTEYDDDID